MYMCANVITGCQHVSWLFRPVWWLPVWSQSHVAKYDPASLFSSLLPTWWEAPAIQPLRDQSKEDFFLPWENWLWAFLDIRVPHHCSMYDICRGGSPVRRVKHRETTALTTVIHHHSADVICNIKPWQDSLKSNLMCTIFTLCSLNPRGLYLITTSLTMRSRLFTDKP